MATTEITWDVILEAGQEALQRGDARAAATMAAIGERVALEHATANRWPQAYAIAGITRDLRHALGFAVGPPLRPLA